MSNTSTEPTSQPAVSTRPVAEQLADAQATLRERDVELAVYKTAGKAGVDAAALLDSRSFMKRVGNLDPAADTYGQDLASLIGEASGEQRFAAQGTPAGPLRSGPDVQGPAEPVKTPEQMSVAELREARAKRRRL